MADRPEATRRSVLRATGLATGAVGLAGCSSLLDRPTRNAPRDPGQPDQVDRY